MATHGVVLADAVDLTTSDVAIVTISAAITRAIITAAKVTNYSASTVTFTLYLDYDGTGATTVHRRVPGISIPAYTSWSVDEIVGCGLIGGGTITASAGANTSLSMHITGTTYP